MSNNKQNLYLITHCESCYNQKNIFCGRLNSKLTKNGITHAQQMAIELKNTSIDLAIHTSLTRTSETLRYIQKYHPNIMIESDDRIIERDYGQLSGKNKQKYQADHPQLYPIYHRSYDTAPPGGESMRDVEKRVLSFLHELITRMKKEHLNVLVVCHGNSIRPMIRYFEHLSEKEIMKLEHMRHKIYNYQV